MILCFSLSMPGVSSWNGKWTGAGRLYAKVKNLGRTKKAEAKGNEIIANGPYGYNWDDGWSARISIHEIDAKEAAKIRKATRGFYGYEWMIDSIILHGHIQTPGRG